VCVKAGCSEGGDLAVGTADLSPGAQLALVPKASARALQFEWREAPPPASSTGTSHEEASSPPRRKSFWSRVGGGGSAYGVNGSSSSEATPPPANASSCGKTSSSSSFKLSVKSLTPLLLLLLLPLLVQPQVQAQEAPNKTEKEGRRLARSPHHRHQEEETAKELYQKR